MRKIIIAGYKDFQGDIKTVEITKNGIHKISFSLYDGLSIVEHEYIVNVNMDAGRVEIENICNRRLQTNIQPKKLALYSNTDINNSASFNTLPKFETLGIDDVYNMMVLDINTGCYNCLTEFDKTMYIGIDYKYDYANTSIGLKQIVSTVIPKAKQFVTKAGSDFHGFIFRGRDIADGEDVSYVVVNETSRFYATNHNEMFIFSWLANELMNIAKQTINTVQILRQVTNNGGNGYRARKANAIESLIGFNMQIIENAENFDLHGGVSSIIEYLQFMPFAKKLKKVQLRDAVISTVMYPDDLHGDIDGVEFNPNWTTKELYKHYSYNYMKDNNYYKNEILYPNEVVIEHYTDANNIERKSVKIILKECNLSNLREILSRINAIYVDKWKVYHTQDANGNQSSDMYYVNTDYASAGSLFFNSKDNITWGKNLAFDKVTLNYRKEITQEFLNSFGLEVFTNVGEIIIDRYAPTDWRYYAQSLYCTEANNYYVAPVPKFNGYGKYDNTAEVLAAIDNGSTNITYNDGNLPQVIWRYIFNHKTVVSAEDSSVIYSLAESLLKTKGTSSLDFDVELLQNVNVNTLSLPYNSLLSVIKNISKSVKSLNVSVDNDVYGIFHYFNPFKWGEYLSNLFQLKSLIHGGRTIDIDAIKAKGLFKTNIERYINPVNDLGVFRVNIGDVNIEDYKYFEKYFTIPPSANHNIPFLTNEISLPQYKSPMVDIDKSFIDANVQALKFFKDDFTDTFISNISHYDLLLGLKKIAVVTGTIDSSYSGDTSTLHPTEEGVYLYPAPFNTSYGGIVKGTDIIAIKKEQVGTLEIKFTDGIGYSFVKSGNVTPTVTTGTQHKRVQKPDPNTIDFTISKDEATGIISVKYVNNSKHKTKYVGINGLKLDKKGAQ